MRAMVRVKGDESDAVNMSKRRNGGISDEIDQLFNADLCVNQFS